MLKTIKNFKFIARGLVFVFLVNTIGFSPLAKAQDFVLPQPGTMVNLSPAFAPPVLKGIKIHQDNPFRFDFILDKGDSQLSDDQIKDESSRLIKYFLASLTIPEKDLWVNLSPYEKNRIVPESFGQTEMGRDLLAEDYMLKQITASLIYPEGDVGKRFWKRIYEEAAKKFGTTNIPVNTFNKVWIVPEKAVVYENAKAGTAYVVESKLKVMLEQDYLSLTKHEGSTAPIQGQEANQLGSQIVREIVIPELTKEVNEDKNFSQLRQVYNSLILATWYKKKIKDSILEQVYADKKKVFGVNIDDPQETQRIYQRYLQAFKKGAYNYIKEDIDPVSLKTIPRKYFSGGLDMAITASHYGVAPALEIINHIVSLNSGDNANMAMIGVNITPLGVGTVIGSGIMAVGALKLSKYIKNNFIFQKEYSKELEKLVGLKWDDLPKETRELIKEKGMGDFLLMAKSGGDQSNVRKLFTEGLAAVQRTIGDKMFEEHWSELVIIAQAAGKHSGEIFVSGYPFVKKQIHDVNSFRKYSWDLVEISNNTDYGVGALFYDTLLSVKKIMGQKFFEKWDDIVRIIKTSKGDLFFKYGIKEAKVTLGEQMFEEKFDDLFVMAESVGANSRNFFGETLGKLKKTLGEKRFKKHWSDIVALTKASGPNAEYLFEGGFQLVNKFIKNDDDFKKWSDQLKEAVILAGENAEYVFNENAVNLVKNNIHDEKSFKYWIAQLVNTAKTSGKYKRRVMVEGFAVTSGMIKDESSYKKVTGQLFEIAKSSGVNTIELFRGLTELKKYLSSEVFNAEWDDIIAIATADGKKAPHLLSDGFKSVKDLIHNDVDFRQYKQRFLRLSVMITDYNAQRVFSLLATSDIFHWVKEHGGDVLKNFDFYLDIFEINPKLGLQVWEGLFDSIKEGLVPIHWTDEEQVKIKLFIKETSGFDNTLYQFYQKEGEDGLKKVRAKSIGIINDQVGVNDLKNWETEFKAKGYDGFMLNLAIVKAAIVLSGASFVKKQEIEGLFRKYLEADDRRDNVPLALQGKTLVETEVEDIRWLLKDGQSFDPNGEIKRLFESLRNPDGEKAQEQKDKDIQEDKKELITALEGYLRDRTNESLRAKAFDKFCAWARHNDLLKEKIDAVGAGNHYETLVLLSHLFEDKDNLSVLLNDVLTKNIDIDLLRKSTNENIHDIKGLVRNIEDIANKDTDRERKIKGIGNRIARYDKQEITDKLMLLLSSQSQDLVKEALDKGNTGIISKWEVIDELFRKPDVVIKQELLKFESRKTGDNMRLSIKAVKGVGHGLWGLCAGVCIATDVELWKDENFYLLAIVDETQKKVFGYVHMYEIVIDGERMLTVPGINPSVELLGKVDTKVIYDLIERGLREAAKEARYKAIYLPVNTSILSNRSDISHLIIKRGYPKITLKEKVNWNNLPSPYPFDEVYSMPLVAVPQENRKGDHAQLSENGGIDLTPANMNLQTQNNNGKIKFHMDPAMLQQLQNAPGFVPVIINFRPLINLKNFLEQKA